MKTCPLKVYPLEPHFYLEKLGFAGVYLFFLIFAPKHRLWLLVRTASLFLLEIFKGKKYQFIAWASFCTGKQQQGTGESGPKSNHYSPTEIKPLNCLEEIRGNNT